MSNSSAKFAIVKSSYRKDIVDKLVEGAVAELDREAIEYEFIEASGSLEIPATVSLLNNSQSVDFDGYITLGCILKGATIHDEVIAYTVFKGLDEFARNYNIPVGNGVLTVNTAEQAIERADKNQQNRGGEAAKAAMSMWKLKRQYS